MTKKHDALMDRLIAQNGVNRYNIQYLAEKALFYSVANGETYKGNHWKIYKPLSNMKKKEELYKDFEEKSKELIHNICEEAYQKGYEQAEADLEAKRLSACEAMTDDECKREEYYVRQFIAKNHRTPTFSDCIEYTIATVWDEVHGFLEACMHEENGKLVNNFGENDYEYLKRCIYRRFSDEDTEQD